MSERDLQNLIFLPGLLHRPEGHATSPAAASAWTWSRPTSRRSAASSTSTAGAASGSHVPHQDPAHAGDHPGADRHQRRRPVRDPAGQPAGAGAPRGEQARERIEIIHGAPVYRLRGNLLPLVYLNRELEIEGAPRAADVEETVNIVVLQADNRRFGLVVDADQRHRGDRRQAAGTAPEGHHRLRRRHHHGRRARRADPRHPRHRAARQRHLLAAPERGTGQHGIAKDDKADAAADAAAVPRRATGGAWRSRCRSWRASRSSPGTRLERLGAHQVVQYRGASCRWSTSSISSAAAGAGGGPSTTIARAADDSIHVVVYNEGQRSIGVVVGQILDIVEEVVDASVGSARGALAGCAVIQQKVTELVNLQALVRDGGAGLLDLYDASPGRGRPICSGSLSVVDQASSCAPSPSRATRSRSR